MNTVTATSNTRNRRLVKGVTQVALFVCTDYPDGIYAISWVYPPGIYEGDHTAHSGNPGIASAG